jgi:ribosomal protein S8E
MSLKDSEIGSPTRKFLKHDAEFRDYITQNPTKAKPFIDFSGQMIIKGRRTKKLMFDDYPEVDDIKEQLRKIRKSQTYAIRETYDALKASKNNIFSEDNVER